MRKIKRNYRRIIMKKLFALMLALVMVLSLVACGGGKGGKVEKGSNKTASGESDKDVMIDIWTIWANDNKRIVWWEGKAAEFAAQYEAETGISVEIGFFNQSGYNGVAEKLTAGTVSGTLPVMSMCEEQQMIQFKAIAEDQSKYVSKAVIDDYVDGLMVSCIWDGVVRAFPCGRSYTMMAINLDVLAATGYTVDDLATWDGLRAACKKAAELGYNGWALTWDSDGWYWETHLYAEGGQIASDDTKKITFMDNNVGAIYMQEVKEMVAEGSALNLYGVVEDPDDGFKELLATNQLLAYQCSCTSYVSLQTMAEEAGISVNKDIIYMMDLPAGKTTGQKSVTTGGSNWFITTAGTETQKQVAGKFIEFLAQPANAAGWNQASGYVCITKGGLASDEYKAIVGDDPNFQRINEGLQYAHARATTPYWREMYTYMNDFFWDFGANSDKYDPVAYMQELADYCQKIIDDAQ